MLTIHPCKHS
jgi:ubiquitin-like-conjugating enzyme ATG3